MRKIIILLMAVSFAACKKEYQQYYYTHIVSFTVPTENGTPVKALADSGRISVSWLQAWPVPDSITPEIVLPEGAKIEPLSGKKVPFRDGFTYVVTAADGTKQQWKLKLDLKQAEPVMNIQTGTIARVGTVFPIAGNNFLEDPLQTRLFLVDKKGIDTTSLPVTALTFQAVSVTIPATVDTGTYHIKMVSGIKTAYSSSFKVMYPLPTVTWLTTKIYKRGETVTLKGTNLRGITGVGLGNVDPEGPFYALEVISYKIDEITLKIPADIPLAAYYSYVQFKTTATGNSVGYGYIRISD